MHKKIYISSGIVKLLSIALDLLTITIVFSVLTVLRKATGGDLSINNYFRLWPFLLVFWLVFEKLGLYNGTSIHSGASIGPAEEIRRIFFALAAIFIALGFSNYCYRPGAYLYSRTILIGTCLCCLILVPFNRFLLRKICTRFGFWGVPAIIIGSGETAAKIFTRLNGHSEYGLRPIGYFTNSTTHQMPAGALFLGTLDRIPERIQPLAIKYAILAKDGDCKHPELQKIIKEYGTLFPHLLFIPESLLHTCSGVVPKDVGGTLGLEIQHNLQIPSIYRLKKIIDFTLTIPCLIAAVPVMAVLAAWIKLDSPGPVFFKQRRITKNGRQINIYKFRTMACDAAEKLSALLESNSSLKKEWERYGKLQNDPRITRAGQWLRKTSLDELPQLVNVLQGKLTLVGPRPIIEEELAIYGDSADLFDKVLPGLTGLWQVSGRNHLNYEDRIRLDNYYVNNWSVWLDLYILAKTVYAVLFRNGAR